MNSQVLERFFSGASEQQQNELLRLFTRLGAHDNVFYAIVFEEKGQYRFGYMSPASEKLTGYKLQQFYEGNFGFFYSITPQEVRASILEQEAYYLKKAKQPGFDITKPFILEVEGFLHSEGGNLMKVNLLAVVLEFTPAHQFHFAINVWMIIDNFRETQYVALKRDIEEALITIQGLYLLIFKERFIRFKSVIVDPIKLSFPLPEVHDLTKREYQSLKLIADGFSSKEVAARLNISFHTAESHRKSLLAKFEAKNTAELIKKATKVYWLE